MDNRRKLLRLEVGDFLEIRPLNERGANCKAKTENMTLMGICFSSQMEWKKGQVLLIDYFLPEEMDTVKIKIAVVWSEFIDAQTGYFCGGEIVDVEDAKEEKFANYYFQKLKERFF